MGRLKRISRKLFGRKPLEFGTNGRDSVVDPQRSTRGLLNIVRPDEKTKLFRMQQTRIKDVFNLPLADAIERLVEANEDIRSAVNIYRNRTIIDYKLEGNPRSCAIVEDMIDGMEERGYDFRTFLRRLVYGIVVEGALCYEDIYSNDGRRLLKLEYVSPWTISFEKEQDPDLGEIDLIGQYINSRFRPLQDPRVPDSTFTYAPWMPLGNKPYGSSQITPAVFNATMMSDLLVSLSEFIQGKILPKGVVSIDSRGLAEAGFEPDEIQEIANQATMAVRGQLDGTNVTQNLAIATQVFFTVIGQLERANIDGAEMIAEILERKIRRGLDIPSVLYGERQRGSSLSDTEKRVGLQSFHGVTSTIRRFIENAINKSFRRYLIHVGNGGECSIVLDDTDPEITRIEAETEKIIAENFNTLMDGFTKASQLQVNGEQAFTPEEIRRSIIEQVPEIFGQLPQSLPQPALPDPEPIPALPEPTTGDD